MILAAGLLCNPIGTGIQNELLTALRASSSTVGDGKPPEILSAAKAFDPQTRRDPGEPPPGSMDHEGAHESQDGRIHHHLEVDSERVVAAHHRRQAQTLSHLLRAGHTRNRAERFPR